jgi:enoyl-[acyl-carrier-protein] reductase (NADH)
MESTMPLSFGALQLPSRFLLSPLAGGITGTVLHVDNGIHAMAVAV